MHDEDRSSKQLKLNKSLENNEAKTRLQQFFETLIEIAKENPELITENRVLNNKEMDNKH